MQQVLAAVGGYLRALRVALAFLTTLPVPNVATWRADDLKLAVRAYPLVGLVLGGVLAVAALLTGFLPPLVRGVLLTALWLLLTGALHFDGFCDLADAALAPKTTEERWRIVKDPRLGSFALAAGGMLLLLKVAGTAELCARANLQSYLYLLIIPVLSRSAVTGAMASFPVYDSSLLGRSAQLRWQEAALPLSTGLLLSALVASLGLGVGAYTATVAAAGFVVAGLAAFLNHRMQGLGGDAYGALIEASEAVMLVVAVAIQGKMG